MDFAEIAVVFLLVSTGLMMAWIIRACRPPKDGRWHARNNEAVAKDRPSFDVYGTKHQRSLRIAAANAKRPGSR
jgi:hypothetical protein